MKLFAVTCRDKSVRLFVDEEEAEKRAWSEDGDSGWDLPMEEIELECGEGQELTEVWLCGLWLAFRPLPHNCEKIGKAYLTFREAQEAQTGTKMRIIHATAELAGVLAQKEAGQPSGTLASQGIYKNAPDPDAPPKPKRKKKRVAPDDEASAGAKKVAKVELD
jgi:hypothetical protein